MKTRIGFAVFAAVCLLSLPALAQRRGTSMPSLRSNMIVTTDWLADHLRDPSVIVLHIARSRSDYDAGHIPGARFVALNEIAITRNGVLNELAPASQLRKVFEHVGLGDDSRAILYGEHQGLLAARAYFTLDYLGHGDRAALLDGGMEKWRQEERPITSAPPQKVATAVFTPRINSRIVVKLQEVSKISRDLVDRKQTASLIDARQPEEFSGDKASDGVKRAGHIPGAKDLYWMEMIDSVEDPELMPAPDVRRLFHDAGAIPGRRVVAYCRTGIQASFLYFVAKFLGYDAALYDGSIMEWSSARDTQVVASPSADRAK